MDELDLGLLQQHFVDALSDCAIILLDVEGNVQTWNAGAQAILGYPTGVIVGRHYSHLLPKDHVARRKPSAPLDEARASDLYEETGRLLAMDGSEVDAYSTISPVYDRQRRLLGFRILARLTPVAKPDGVADPANAVAPGEGGHILAVDDDARVLEVMLSQLRSLGYRVTGASSGAQALEILAGLPDVDLLFTDVSMPGGIGGRDVAEKAVQMRPGLKVLFASGYFEHALVRNGSLTESAAFLVKPYRKRDLAQKVREVLTGSAP